MAITRIFRVRIAPELGQEFEENFSSVSMDVVNKAEGLLAVSIHKPTKWAPNEYAMISHWENEAALESFAGERWNRAVIPPKMEKYVLGWEVHHYEAW
jgi:heme-degrading monooxygenase HmoA